MKPNKLFWIIWAVWLVLNVLTSLMMEIYTDEAYYRLYGQFLAWGYYDHPPMVGLMAWVSDHLMCQTTMLGLRNLTVRLTTILTHALTVWLLFKTMADDREVTRPMVVTFFMVAAGMVMLSTTGFMLTPDSPLLLFATLFFYAYQKYLKGSNLWQWALVLGVAIAGMLYSKYMGVLVVAFVVLSNWQLVKDGRLWCALLLALALMTPHFWWQISHGFPSLQYHLVARNEGFDIDYILEYWPNQLVVYNPLLLVLMIVGSIVTLRQRKEDMFERGLAVTILGFLFFFWLMTVKGHAEPHWTMAASVPAVLLLTRILTEQRIAWMNRRWVCITLWCMVGLIQVARVVLWTNCLPLDTALGSKHQRYDYLKEISGDKVMVSIGSFQWPSMYRFWYGEAVLVHDIEERHTQYEYIDIDYPFQGQPASICDPIDGCHDTVVYAHNYHHKMVNRLQMTDRMRVTEQSAQVDGDSLRWQLSIANPYAVAFDFQHDEMPCRLQVAAMDTDWCFAECKVCGPMQIPARDSARYTVTCSWRDLTSQSRPEKIQYMFTLYNTLAHTENSPWQTISLY
ncbi:MAG: glycosyltransferase family 39 protein [Paludibacteraceae bacterium]|nr:glycosyltransferase family 39 protein [Paludibacteraceae bacterium]